MDQDLRVLEAHPGERLRTVGLVYQAERGLLGFQQELDGNEIDIVKKLHINLFLELEMSFYE